MEATRLQKVSRLLQKEMGGILQRGSLTFCGGKMVTVTTVRVTPDLGKAKFYLSIFPNGNNDTLTLIKSHTKSIRFELGKLVHNQMRVIPELDFFIDDSLDYVEKIENLLKK